jgi:hypothetical protein
VATTGITGIPPAGGDDRSERKQRGSDTVEKREYERFLAREVKPKEARATHVYRILNISRSGCLLESRKVLGAPNSSIIFDLPLPADAESLTLAARIVRKDGCRPEEQATSPRYGLEFDRMDRVSEMILDAYLDFVRKDMHIAKLEEACRKLRRVREELKLLIPGQEK